MSEADIIIFTGPMYSGKSTRLITIIKKYLFLTKDLVVYKSKCDNRYDNDSIITHNLDDKIAQKINFSTEIVSMNNTDIIFDTLPENGTLKKELLTSITKNVP